MSIPIRIKRSAVPNKKPTVDQLKTGELSLNIHDADLYAKRIRPGIGTDIVNLNAGPRVQSVLYVTKDGSDTNTGKKLGDAKATIKAAIEESQEGTIIKVSPGVYEEDNPIKLPPQVSIVGDSLREVTIKPQNPGDLFHVSPGNYISDVSFAGDSDPGRAVFAFDPDNVKYFAQSPYIRNCTNFIPDSIGMKIDGRYAIGPLKSMLVDSFTQYNQGGIGVSITHEGYAQLVSLFTIAPDIAVYSGSGAACDLTNSNSSFGNYGLIADGIGALKYTGIVSITADPGKDTFTLDLSTPEYDVSNAVYDNVTGILTVTTSQPNIFSVGMGVSVYGLSFSCPYEPGLRTYPSGESGYTFNVNNVGTTTSFSCYVGTSTLPHTYDSGGKVKIDVIRPFDGQVVYFDELYYTVDKLNLTFGGSGYVSQPIVSVDPPNVPWGVSAQVVAVVENGSITGFEIVSNGRGYTSVPNVTIYSTDVGINTATATCEILPTYHSILRSTLPTNTGICTITINENLPYSVGVGTEVYFFKQSRILASGHSFEFIGSGTEIPDALPFSGGVPIQENETDSRNGGLVVYTSTDQSGNFRIGDGVVIDQNTGTISGSFYSKSLFANVTPFILALGGQ